MSRDGRRRKRARLRRAFFVGLLGLQASARAEALEITDRVQAPFESCHVNLARYPLAPRALRDCFNQSCVLVCQNDASRCPSPCDDPNCGRLIPELRDAARTADAREILVRAAFEFYLVRHPELRPSFLDKAQALADLAVTGRAAYASFRRLAPDESALMGAVRQRLLSSFPTHAQVPGDLSGAVQQALHRSYEVAWALRGPTPYRTANRDRLGWIAVDAEDDPPHRPVNIPSAPFPQFDMTVRVDGIDVATRYIVASRHVPDDHPVDLGAAPPDREHPLVIGDVIIFIHGHSSSAEEAGGLAEELIAQAAGRGRPVTLIAMDLPSNGYASMIEHTSVAPAGASIWNAGYPILDFIESFVVAFVAGLERRQPGITGQIVGVVGGSLGGNMTLRLGRRDLAVHPWLHSVVSWSPASTWLSWARAVIGVPTAGRYYDLVKYEGVRKTRDQMAEAEKVDSLHLLFHETLLFKKVGRAGQADHWYSESWPCRGDAITASHRSLYEIYNERFRRWHWRVAHEQLIFSHWDSDNRSFDIDPDPRNNPAAGPARYSQVRARLLLAAGYDDDFMPEKLFSNTRDLARAMTGNGSAFFVEATGHSIHAEKPAFFADRILTFLFESPPPPFPAFLVPATSF